MAVELLVAGWFVSVLISKVAELPTEYVKNKINCHKKIKSNLAKLEDQLTEIASTISIVGKGDLSNPELEAWFSKLKDAMYRAEDMLDKFAYDILRKRASGKTFMHKAGDAAELDTVVESLKDIVNGAGRFLSAVRHNDENNGINQHVTNWRVTAPGRSQPTLVGRNSDKDFLKSFLLEPVSNDGENFSMISVFGIAGVGKTALARFAYHDETVKEHFPMRAWVSVTHKFDVKSLTIKCIESGSIKRPRDLHQIQGLDVVQAILENVLRGKRFLIVLDDVWSDEGMASFLEPLRVGEEGSKVLVTTRYKSVATKFSTWKRKMIYLKGLKFEECWCLLSKHAFGNQNRSSIRENTGKDIAEVENIGKDIAKGLAGLPLVAETIGRALQEELSEDHWREVMNSNIYEVEIRTNKLLRNMRLSYEELLDITRQQCFLSCSLFPSDHNFCKTELVRIWMALGFLRPKEGNKTMEVIGSRYFDEFVNMDFFVKEKTNHGVPGEAVYKMNRAFHQLAEFLSGGEYFRIDYKENCYNPRDSVINIPHRARHVRLDVNDLLMASESLNKKTYRRSLIITGTLPSNPKDANPIISTLERILKEQKCLRVLILSDLLPRSFEKPWHLRYFKVESSSSTDNTNAITLPKWLRECYHLQTLAADLDCKRMSFEKPIDRLIMLRWLDTKPETMHIIPRIGKIISLQEIAEFHVKRNAGFGIDQLEEMNEIKGRLCITHLENVRNGDDAKKAKLNRKQHLRILELRWDEEISLEPAHDVVLEGLKPHAHIRELKINGYMGEKYPTWLKDLEFLERLSLDNCRKLKSLPQELKVKALIINNCPRIDSFSLNKWPPQLKEFKVNGYTFLSSSLWQDAQSLNNFTLQTRAEIPTDSIASGRMTGRDTRQRIR